MPPFVTYSLLALCGAVIVAGFWLGGRREGRFAKFSRWSLVLQIAGLVGGYAVLRPGSGYDPTQLTAAMEHGQPVFIDVYSNF